MFLSRNQFSVKEASLVQRTIIKMLLTKECDRGGVVGVVGGGVGDVVGGGVGRVGGLVVGEVA